MYNDEQRALLRRRLASGAALGAAAIVLCGCAGSQTAGSANPPALSRAAQPGAVTAAERWVLRSGGHLGAGDKGWFAVRRDWRGRWPWPSSSAVVSCTAAYGGTAGVQLDNGRQYWLVSKHMIDGQTLFVGQDSVIARDQIGAVLWEDEVSDLCGLSTP